MLVGRGVVGKTKLYIATLAVPAGGTANLRSLADADGYDGTSGAIVVFQTSGNITGNANGGHGIDTGSWPAGVHLDISLENTNTFRGGGGQGGAGGTGSFSNGGNGGAAGDAVYCRIDLTINNVGGVIEAAGGGAGGGAGGDTGGQEPLEIGGGGGGGGFPNGSGGLGGDVSGATRDGDPGNPGTVAGGGTGGAAGQAGAAAGGNGGNANTDGAAGGDSQTASGGNAGPRGFAIRRNGFTVSVIGGTVIGDQG